MPAHVALTALTGQVHPDELSAVAAALQIQVVRDFFPEWGVHTIVSACSFESIPSGAIPLIVQDTLTDPAANGFHRTRGDDTPYIVVPHGRNWSLAASHELLRMLANPSGSSRVPGPSRMLGQGSVEYLLDVCGPCQDVAACYAIDGVAVADFCNRGFFAASGVASTFTGVAGRAFQPNANGVVSWLADDDLLYQARADGMGRIRVHGGFSPGNRGRVLPREFVDMLTPERLILLVDAPRTALLVEAEQNARRTHFTNARRFGEDIAWRFGEASTAADVVEPHRAARRLSRFVSGAPAPNPGRIGDDVDMTVRNAS